MVMVLAGLAALPLSASAQDTDKGWVEEFYPELAPEEPALQLAPGYLPYTFQEMELRLRRATFGLGFSVAALVIGFGMGFAAALCSFSWDDPSPCPEPWVAPVGYTGLVLAVGGLAGTIASSVVRREAKRKLRRLRAAHYGNPRRVQWDLARSRLVF
jgi:hypothetical protein